MAGDKHSGKILDERYELVRLLDEGGMGAVYLGRHTKIGRKAAVKFLHAALVGQEDVVKRFYREAQAASAISHPNIIDIFDVGVAEWGEPYLVMEYLSGENLDSLLARKRPIGLAGACAILDPALRALAAAHEHGIVHRDIKPENIFIVRQPDAPPLIKLIDFGISKFVQEDTLKLTRTGTLLGTPSYMSPEQARGKGEVDKRADLYSIGVILFQMLTGELPFVGESYNDLIFTILTEPRRDPHDIDPDFPDEALPLVERLLQKDPGDRYQSCQEVLADLEAISVYDERVAALEALIGDMPEDGFATGDLGPEYQSDEAVAATVLANITPEGTEDTASENDTVDIPPEVQEDDRWVMESSYLPTKTKHDRPGRRAIWPLFGGLILAVAGIFFYASGLLKLGGRDDASQTDAAMRRINDKIIEMEKAGRQTDRAGSVDTPSSVPLVTPPTALDSDALEDDALALDTDSTASVDTDTETTSRPDTETKTDDPVADSVAPNPAPKDDGNDRSRGAQRNNDGDSPPTVKQPKTVTPAKPTEPALPKVSIKDLIPNEPPPLPPREPATLTPSDVNRIVSKKDARIQRCYEMATIKTPGLQGTVVLHIGVVGKNVRAKVVENGVTPQLAACVVRVITSIRPPLNTGELVEIEKTYDFELKN